MSSVRVNEIAFPEEWDKNLRFSDSENKKLLIQQIFKTLEELVAKKELPEKTKYRILIQQTKNSFILNIENKTFLTIKNSQINLKDSIENLPPQPDISYFSSELSFDQSFQRTEEEIEEKKEVEKFEIVKNDEFYELKIDGKLRAILKFNEGWDKRIDPKYDRNELIKIIAQLIMNRLDQSEDKSTVYPISVNLASFGRTFNLALEFNKEEKLFSFPKKSLRTSKIIGTHSPDEVRRMKREEKSHVDELAQYYKKPRPREQNKYDKSQTYRGYLLFGKTVSEDPEKHVKTKSIKPKKQQ